MFAVPRFARLQGTRIPEYQPVNGMAVLVFLIRVPCSAGRTAGHRKRGAPAAFSAAPASSGHGSSFA
jgi:hypothetical protein